VANAYQVLRRFSGNRLGVFVPEVEFDPGALDIAGKNSWTFSRRKESMARSDTVLMTRDMHSVAASTKKRRLRSGRRQTRNSSALEVWFGQGGVMPTERTETEKVGVRRLSERSCGGFCLGRQKVLSADKTRT
jgi:hypothetical protein